LKSLGLVNPWNGGSVANCRARIIFSRILLVWLVLSEEILFLEAQLNSRDIWSNRRREDD